MCIRDRHYSWSFEHVQQQQELLMNKAFNEICKLSEEYDVDMRTAAYMMSIHRIDQVMKLRGWY